MNYRITGIILVFLFLHHWTWAQMFEDNWQTERTFRASRAYRVSINNKYGSVMVSTWDKDSVRISVTRRVSEKSADRLKRMVESIDIRFREGQGQVWAETFVGSRHTTFIQDVREAGNFSSATPRTKIDYQIMVPPHVHLEITNKYGDIVLPTLSGYVKIDLSNGNLQARDLTGLAEMNLAFGSAEIRRTRQGTFFLNFVNFNIDEAEALTIDGRSSEIRVKDAEQLKLSSRRDRIFITNVRHLDAETYFSNIHCQSLVETALLKLTYGRLEQLNLASGFKSCDIISQTCDVNITLLSPTLYSALIKANKTVNLPAELKPEIADYKKRMSQEPVRFIFRRKADDDKFNINISDGELKIDHR